MIFKVVGTALAICLISVVIKNHNPQYGTLLSAVGAVMLVIFAVDNITESVSFFSSFFEEYSLPADIIQTLLKCLGIAVISEIGCDICLDCGEKALCTGLSLISKIVMLTTAIPLFRQVSQAVSQFL